MTKQFRKALSDLHRDLGTALELLAKEEHDSVADAMRTFETKSAKLARAYSNYLDALQVREYNERYHPELADGEVEISSCGRFVRVHVRRSK